MLRNYITVAFRNLYRHKGYTAINVIGLSLGLACVIVAFVIYSDANNFDSFHKNYASIYRVIGIQNINNNDARIGYVPLPLGSRLKQDCPQVKNAVRIDKWEGYVKNKGQVISEDIAFADSGFFEMFTFPLSAGTADLTKANQIVISEEYAKKYFGSENPIGGVLTITMPNTDPCQVTVTGVVKPYPYNSSIRFNILASSKLLVDIKFVEPANWTHITWAQFVQIPDKTNLQFVQSKLNELLSIQTAANPNRPLKQFFLEPLKDVAMKSRITRGNILTQSIENSFVYGIGIPAILILLMGCINYVNTALANSARRVKEIGVRKVMGSGKSQLVLQFLTEHIVVCVISLILGVCLAELLAPGLSSLFPFVDLSVDPIQDPRLLGFMFAVVIITAVGAGSYPAFVISSYNPIGIFRNRFQAGKINILTRAFLGFQLALSMIAVAGAVVFAQNSVYNEKFDQGYETRNVMGVGVVNNQTYTVIENEIKNHPGIVSISGSRLPVRTSNSRVVVQHNENKLEVVSYQVGLNYLETIKLRLKEGRMFSLNTPSDTSDCVVINELLASEMGLTSPVDQILTYRNKSYRIIGVVKDFYNAGTNDPISPCMFRACSPQQYTVMNILIQPGQAEQVMSFVESTWKRLFPDIPFSAGLQNSYDDEAIQISKSASETFFIFAVMAILIASMGIFALVSMNMARRAKEVGIRKVLGATISNIMLITNRDMIILMICSALIANIGGYFLINLLMDSIWRYHVSVSTNVMLASNILIVIGVICTVGWQIWKAATANPVESLKYE